MEVINIAEEHSNNSSSSTTLVFAINNRRFELTKLDDPSTTLLQFLRTRTSIKSPKLGCGQGGCGACVVLLSNYDSRTEKVESFTVSSCLTLLGSVHGCSITTSEGIGNSRDGFHEIHRRFAGFHASQCGFCTPGMCMSLYGALVSNGGEKLMSVVEAEKAVSGNLCRCTGYRSISDACKSFAADIDMEDLGGNSFCRLPSYNSSPTFPEFLKMQGKSGSVFDSWVVPRCVEEIRRLMKGNGKVKLVVGNTGIGYYKEDESCDRYIDIRYVPEFSRISNGINGIKFGAAVTISRAVRALKASGCGGVVYRKIAEHMEKIATPFVRNTGSIGGNLVMAQRKGFPSDIATILIAAGSYVEILTSTSSIRERLTLEEFLQERPPLDSGDILISIEVPSSRSVGSRVSFETYRASPRPLGNASAHLSSAFLAEIDDGNVISSCRLAFGGCGTIRARKAEDFLAGKKVTDGVVYEAIRLVKASVGSSSDTEYKSSLAVGFVFEFLSPLIIEQVSINGLVNEASEASHRLLSSGKQIFQVHRDHQPVGEPIRKSEALIQASGEAVYVDDIPSPANCLYGAFVCSTKPFARVKGIGFPLNRLPDGVVALLSSKDIPNGGKNLGSKTFFGTETLFADDVTRCAGECLGFVVADSQKQADAAANMVVVDYETVGMEPPILTVEEAVKRSSFISIPPFFKAEQVGDITRGIAEADCRIINAEMKLNSQYYFYMETQTAMAVPDEDKCMVVYSSSQCPEAAGVTIAECLGVPQHNVRVITRRVGGAFGGKALKSIPIATACALAAQLLHRPVRTYLNRKTDMIMTGGRHPMNITYSVFFKSRGKITALKLQILIDAGMSPDASAIIPIHLVSALKKYDWGALSFDIRLCKTNRTSKSTMRAPGAVQGAFIADTVMENVASSLRMDADDLKGLNLHCYESIKLFHPGCCGEDHEYTLRRIWEKLAESSEFYRRREMVEGFNRDNLWRKKGISRVPIVFEAGATKTPGKVSILSDGSIVVEVGGIELGQGLWTKTKQMAAFALSSIHSDAADSLLEKIRIIQADTLTLIQGGFTGGSTKSESSCEAIRLCCNVLVERLAPLKEKLEKESSGAMIGWEMLISQAYRGSVNMSASCLYVPDFTTNHYLNYGAAATEVEINLLTGETTILRSDLIYDCGQSLNPAVDMGQIEGAFVQGIGFFMMEEYNTNSDGLLTTDSTWTYKIPTVDTIPKQFNVEILSSGHHRNRVLSSKASGEPPLLLAASVHCATRAAIKEARKQLHSWGGLDSDSDYADFQLEQPATMPVVKKLCGFNCVESHLKWKLLNHTKVIKASPSFLKPMYRHFQVQ